MRTVRPALAAVLVTALSAFGIVGVASPALADAIDVPSLQAELDASAGLSTVVDLDTDILAPGTVVWVNSSVTLDLNGHDLALFSLQLTPGVTLEITDSVGSGTLTANSSGGSQAGIHSTGATLLISGGTVTAVGNAFGAAIGGEHSQDAGAVTISGGTVTATSGEFSAAIGGGGSGPAGVIAVTGGTVTATGGRGAAIGSGSSAPGASGSITISGGTVTASTRVFTYGAPIGGGAYSTSGPISISGGTVTADASLSDGAAAIGSGGTDDHFTIPSPSVTISGGTVIATAGGTGAGIGGGGYGPAGTVSILGTADVTATGNPSGAAIGSGYVGTGGTISIAGSATVNATNHSHGTQTNAAAIGSGFLSAAVDVTIAGGTVTASTNDGTSDTYGAAIGSGMAATPGTVTISGGSVSATGGQGGAGIGGGSNSDSGTIIISGGTVTASARQFGASIGSGLNASSTSITISGGNVKAYGSLRGAGIGGGEGSFVPGTGAGGTITISGGTVEAHQQYQGAAIGGGHAGVGANVVIGAGATVTGISDPDPDPSYTEVSIIGPGVDASSFGTLSIDGSLVVGVGSYLEVPNTSTTTIASTGSISGPGSVVGYGVATIVNHGYISTPVVWVPVVTDHNYLVTFEPNTTDTTTPSGATDVRVYATTMAQGARSIPAYDSDHEFLELAGWSTTATGRADFSTSTTLSGDRSVYAVWGPPYLELSPTAPLTPEAGDSITFTTVGYGFDQNVGGRVELGDFTGQTTFTTNDPTATVSGNVVTFGHAGVVTVTATMGSVSTDTTVNVQPGPLDSIVVTFDDPSEDLDNLVAGNTVGFSVEGFDVNGTSRGDYTNDIDVTSTDATDATYDGAVYFETAGTRTISITADADARVGADFEVTVVPAALKIIEPEFPNYSITAGVPMSIVVNGFDLYDNPLGDVSSQLEFDNSNWETFSGNEITFEEVGSRIVTISHPTDADIQAKQVTVDISAAPLNYFILDGSQTTATAGDSVYFNVFGYDAFDNYVGNYNATSTLSSNLQALVVGTTVRVEEAGIHTITATLGSVTGTWDVDVSVGDPYSLLIAPTTTGPVVAGTSRTYTAHTVDEWGNVIADVTSRTEFGSYVMDGVDYPENPVSGSTVDFTTSGLNVVVGNWLDFGNGDFWGDLDVTVVPAAVDSIQISPSSDSVQSGESITFVVSAFDEFGNPVVLAPGDATLSNILDGETISGLTVTFGQAGTDEVTATVGALTDTATISVGVGTLDSIEVFPATSPITAGGSTNFVVAGWDAYGNVTTATGLATFTSSDPTAVFTGDNGTFTTAGAPTVTATIGALSDYVVLTVDPGAADYLVVTSSTPGTVVAGQQRTYVATAYDQYDNLVGDVTATTTFTSTNASDASTGATFTFEEAGGRTIEAEWDLDASVDGDVGVVVVGNEADPASLTINASSTTADQHGMITITVTGVDRFGNPLTGLEDNVAISSSVATDVINGNQISFPHASPHVITVTLGTASASVLIEVRPAVSAAALGAAGTDSIGMLVGAALVLLFGILAVVFRRRALRDLPTVS